MTKEEIIRAIVCEVKDYRFTHDELMRMSKKELLQYYPQFALKKSKAKIGAFGHPIYGKGFAKM